MNKKWLWIVLAIVAVLAVAGAVFAIFVLPAITNQGDEIIASDIYWNVDKLEFTENSDTGLSVREKAEDGLYHFRFVSNGQLINAATPDKQMVNFIDTMDACGLVLDADGMIVDAMDVRDFAVETAKRFYVKAVESDSVTINSSIAMNGMDIEVDLSSVMVMDVRPDSENLGKTLDLEVMDVVSVYGTEENPMAYMFACDRPASSDIYLRLSRRYYDAINMTSRVPDENGVYTIDFAVGGKVVDLKCKDVAVVNEIDVGTDTKQVMGLTFDEEGYINGVLPAATAMRGTLHFISYNITAIDGDFIEATRLMSGSEQGNVMYFTLTDKTEIIMNENGCVDFVGQKVDSLKLDDRVTVWTDMEENALYIKVDRRVAGDKMYWLQDRKYNATEKVTTRVPNGSGYYVFELLCEGKTVTAKTKDKDLATKLDGNGWQYFGLKIEKGIIKEYYDPNCVCGGKTVDGQRFVTQIADPMVQYTLVTNFGSAYNYISNSNIEIYDMTGDYGTKLGQKTTLKLGDRVRAARNSSMEITHVYVLSRYHAGTKIYYNLNRQWNSTTMETNRKPETTGENAGYYVFEMALDGKILTVKTKNKVLADIIDKQNNPIVAMKVNKDGVVTAAYPATAAVYLGQKVFNNNTVGEITEDGTISCYYYSGGEKVNAASSYRMAENCKVYNATTNYSKYRGEKSKVKVGDTIQGMLNENGELAYVWIVRRSYNSPLFVHTNRQYANGETTRVPDADGYYKVDLFVDGKIKTYKTKSKEVMSSVDAFSQDNPFTLRIVKGNIIELADVAAYSVYAPKRVVGYYDVVGISGKTITTLRTRPGQSNTGDSITFTYDSSTKIYDISSYSDNRLQKAKLKKGDRILVFGDYEGNINYIFVMYPMTREAGHKSKCAHCNKTVYWEPYDFSFITTAKEDVHYYLINHDTRGQISVGYSLNTYPNAAQYNVVLDLNGKTLTSTGRNFLVYNGITIMDSKGGGVLQANSSSANNGGNFMVAGGTVTLYDGVTLRQNDSPDAGVAKGGNFIVHNLTIKETGKTRVGTLNIKNAKLEAWDCPTGSNILMQEGTVLNISGGSITGGNIQVAEDVKIKLSGSPKISGEGLDLTSGAKIKESNLSGKAKVVIAANGIFTQKLSNVNAQKAFYEAERKYYPIQIKQGALWTDRDPSKADFKKEPAIPEKPELLSVNNADLALNANKQAKCPVCNKTVTWTAITGVDAVHELEDGKHYYLPGDLTFEKVDKPFIQVASGVSTCLHLNGHNITATNAMAVLNNGTMNIMGNGIVSGTGYDNDELISKPQYHASTIEVNNKKAVLNLYGGTYTRPVESNGSKVTITGSDGNKTESTRVNHILGVQGEGGTVNLFDGATIDGAKLDKYSVRSYWGMFNMYGGTVLGGKSSAIDACNWGATSSGGVSIYGGTVKAGNGYSVFAAGAGDAIAYMNLYGGELIGNASFNASAKVVVAGKPVVSKLTIPTNKNGKYEGKIILGKLTDGASINVSGKGIFAYACENAADYLKYFHSLTDEKVVINNYSLSFYVMELPEVPDTMPAYTADLEFIEDSKYALCAVCEQYVKWTPVTQETHGTSGIGQVAGGATHYYLTENITYTGSKIFMSASDAENATACLHLNGHDLTATGAVVAHGSINKLSILGSGTVSGNGYGGGAISINRKRDVGAGVYLYSGTYKSYNKNANRVLLISDNGGRIFLGKDATVVAKANQRAILVAGSNHSSSQLTVQGRVEGGYIEMWQPTAGQTGTLVLDGGYVEGGVKPAQDNTIKLSGEAEVYGLDMTAGAKITESNLTGNAKVVVAANGTFSEVLSNIDQQLAFYEKEEGYRAVANNGGALWTEPEPDVSDVYITDLTFTDGNKAECPVCGLEVQWTAVDQATYGATGIPAGATDTHYYLTEDVTFTKTEAGSFLAAPAGGKTICFHLNGHNLTGKQNKLFAGGEGTLNILGNGVVIGGNATTNEGAAVVAEGTGVINLYGGNFTKQVACDKAAVISVSNNGGKINVYKTAKVTGLTGAPAIVTGTSQTNKTELVLDGTTVDGDILINTPDAKATVVTMKNAKANIVTLKAGATFKVSDNTVIEKLIVAENAKITVGKLLDAAKINVQGSGVITETNSSMESYASNFVSTYGCELSVKDNALFSRDLNKLDNSKLVFEADTNKALCPYCQKVVEWTAIKSTDTYLLTKQTTHYYLETDTEVTADSTTDGFLFVNLYDRLATDAVCLHTNGYKLTVNGNRAIMAGPGKLNIMGTGTVSGDNTSGATVHINGKDATSVVNLFGGTFVKPATNKTGQIVHIGANGGTLNIYDGATIDGGNIENNETYAVQISTASSSALAGVVNMYGGTVKDGNNVSGSGGNIRLMGASATFNMYGGTVKDGKAPKYNAGNIYCASGTMNLLGGTVSGGTASRGGNIYIGIAPAVLTTRNVTISGGVATGATKDYYGGGNIGVEAANMIIEHGTVIKDGLSQKNGQGGNIRGYKNTTITMNGGVISGGMATGYYDANVYLYGTSSTVKAKMYMNGGVIYAQENPQGLGTGIRMYQHATVYLAKGASVIDADGAKYAGVRLSNANNCKLALCDGWYGSATVGYASKYASGAAIPSSLTQIITLDANLTETAGGTIHGSLAQLNTSLLALVAQEDGSFKVS